MNQTALINWITIYCSLLFVRNAYCVVMSRLSYRMGMGMGGIWELLDGKKWEWDLSFRWEWEWDGNGN